MVIDDITVIVVILPTANKAQIKQDDEKSSREDLITPSMPIDI